MIKAVIFDVGGVLMYDTMPGIYDDITQTLHLDTQTLRNAWDKIAPQLSTGEITEDDFWKQFVEMTQTDQSLPEQSLLQRQYKVIRNEEVYDIVTKLKDQKSKLAVLSNTIESHVAINKAAGLFDEFPVQIFSNEVGYIKPSKEIFLLTSKALQTKPEETIFIDDNLKNVQTANALGFHGIHFTSAEALKKDLLKLYIKL